MNESKPNSCRTLTPTTTKEPNIQPNSPPSYFINITIPRPKIRIKIPKLLIKAMQIRRTTQRCSNADDGADLSNSKKKKEAKPKKLHLKKVVGSIFSNVFDNKKSPETCSTSGGKDGVNSNGDSFNEARMRTSSARSLNCEAQQFPEYSGSHSLKEMLKIEEEEVKQKRLDDRKNLHGSIVGDKPPLKLPLSSISSFFNKKSGLDFIKCKINKTSCNSSSSTSRGDRSANGVGTNYYSVKLRRGNSIRKKVIQRVEKESEQGGGEEERGDEELCKKRILMGERCRPLNISGVLHYDKNGTFLPEEVLP